MSEIEKYLKEAFLAVTIDQYPDLHKYLNPQLNIFDVLDSFNIVDILIESENILQEKLGRYVSLADENIFDASKSPFLTWSSWIFYVEEKYGCHE
jgi:hypothetical protein